MSQRLFDAGVSRDAALQIERSAGQRSGGPASRRLSRTVSVCIVNWHCRELLRACLQSLVNAAAARRRGDRGDDDPAGLQIIVVDNGSTDGADMVARAFPQVQL